MSFTNIDRRALSAVALQFFVNGALFASFVPRLPEIRDRVGVSVAGIGIMMSIAGVFGLVASALASPAIDRFGSRRVMVVTAVILALSLPIIGLATSPVVLMIGLLLMLSFDVPVDVSMNLQGAWLSSRRHSPVMNRLHGLWSLGTLIGGVVSSRAAAFGVSLATHLFAASVVLLGVVGFVSRGLLSEDEEISDVDENGSTAPAAVRGSAIIFLFGGLFAFAIESTSIDWAAFRLADDFGVSAGMAALGYVAFTVGMTTGRFGGDWITVKLGQERLTIASTALSGVGLAMATLVPDKYVAFIGFGLAGLGVATMFPALYDAAARHRGKAGSGLGALTAGIRVSSLAMPFTVGTIAATSLSVGSAMAFVLLSAVVGFFVVVTIASQPIS